MVEENNKPKRKTHTSTAVKRRYNAKTYTRIFADLPKELVANFKAAIREDGTTTAEVFRTAINEYLKTHQAAQKPVSQNAQERTEID